MNSKVRSEAKIGWRKEEEFGGLKKRKGVKQSSEKEINFTREIQY